MKRRTDGFMVLVKTAGWRYNQHSKHQQTKYDAKHWCRRVSQDCTSSPLQWCSDTLSYTVGNAAGLNANISSRNNSLILFEVSLVLLACVKFPPVVAPSSDAAEAPRKLSTILRQPSCLSAVLTMASSYRSWDSTLERYMSKMDWNDVSIIHDQIWLVLLIHSQGIVFHLTPDSLHHLTRTSVISRLSGRLRHHASIDGPHSCGHAAVPHLWERGFLLVTFDYFSSISVLKSP